MTRSTNQKSAGFTVGIVALMLAVVACTCGPLSQVQEAASTFEAVSTEFEGALPTIEAELTAAAPTTNAMMTEMAAGTQPFGDETGSTATPLGGNTGGQSNQGSEGGQWATGASATSQYGDDAWSAMQATGAPDTPQCGDQITAWASGTPNEIASLTLTYQEAVIPTGLHIFQTYNPGHITRIEVVEPNGTSHTVYTAQPQANPNAQCPDILSIDITDVNDPVNQVVITVDQTNLGSWNEIDAVELIGNP